MAPKGQPHLRRHDVNWEARRIKVNRILGNAYDAADIYFASSPEIKFKEERHVIGDVVSATLNIWRFIYTKLQLLCETCNYIESKS